MNLKTLTLSSVVLLGLANAHADATPHSLLGRKPLISSKYSDADKKMIAFRQHLAERKAQTNFNSSTAKTTAAKSRIIAQAIREFKSTGFAVTDTVHAYYTGVRGGDFTTGVIKYDSLKFYDASSGTVLLYGLNEQTFDAKDNILTTTVKSYDDASKTFVNESKNFYTYNADNNVVKDSSINWDETTSSWENYEVVTSTYTAGKMLAQQTTSEWDGTAFTPYLQYEYTYTAADKVAKTILKFYDGSAWKTFVQQTNTYDAGTGLLSESVTQADGSGSGILENSSRELYTYDAAKNPIIVASEDWDNSFKAWYPYTSMYNKFDAAGNKTEAMECMVDDISGVVTDTLERTLFTYNMYNQVLSDVSQEFDPSTHTFSSGPGDYKNNYYYEEYTPANVKEIAGVTNLSIYPVPAAKELNFVAKLETAQAVTIAMSDLQGRIVSTVSLPASNTVRTVLSVANVPSGTYYIILSGEKGAHETRQIVVAH